MKRPVYRGCFTLVYAYGLRINDGPMKIDDLIEAISQLTLLEPTNDASC